VKTRKKIKKDILKQKHCLLNQKVKDKLIFKRCLNNDEYCVCVLKININLNKIFYKILAK